ncbi:MAG: hypothetical protein IGR92_13085 [Leptolyngbyaceae cyanobacterium T60_A2020_046]|nr:hypothetical protein [Leptolyngbyaceae cyanobacterium T60_A2020_046]
MHPKELTPMQALKRSLQLVAQAAPIELRRLALLNLTDRGWPVGVSVFRKGGH